MVFMEAIEAIMSRRSIRKFKQKEISQEHIDVLMAAAMAAPSAVNEQPWHFILVKDRELVEKICGFHNHAQMAMGAPLSIIVCADRKAAKSHEAYIFQDCSAAIENLMVAAKALGLGAVWTGVYPNEARMQGFRTLFSLPESIVPFAMIVIGHPDEEKEAKKDYDKSRVHEGKW